MAVYPGQPRRPGNPLGINPGGGAGGGYTGSQPGYGQLNPYSFQASQGVTSLDAPPAGGGGLMSAPNGNQFFRPGSPGAGLVNGVPGHWAQMQGGYGAVRPGMPQATPPGGQQQAYQPPPPPAAAANAPRVPAAPSHAGFNGVVAPTPGNGLAGWSTNNPIGAKSSAQAPAGAAWSWSGSGGGGQAYAPPQPGVDKAGGGRPTAWSGAGSIAPSGGGSGGGGGVGGGASVNGGSVGNQFQKYYDEANAANEGRYQQLLGLSGQLSDAGMQREQKREAQMMGRVDQHAVSAGLGNTTVLPTLERGVADDSALRQEEIADQGLKTTMGIIERRTDQAPDLGLLASLASRPGATGGYGGINPYGASLGAIGSPATHHGASTRGGGSLGAALAPSQGTNDYSAGGWANGGGGGAGIGGPGGGIGGSGMIDGYAGNAPSSVWDGAGGGGQLSYDQEGNPVSLMPGGVRYNQYGEMIDENGNLI